MSDNMEHDCASESSCTLEKKHEHQWSLGWRLPAMLFGPLLVVLAVAIGHDQYLIGLHGSLIGSYNDQLIVKGANNGLATLASLLLGISVTAGSTEITWDFIRRSRLSIEHLDAMFQLPSPVAFLAAPSVVRRASYLILVSLVCYSLTIVSIFVPGSLSVREDMVVNATVIDLASGLYYNTPDPDNILYGPYETLPDVVYSGPSGLFIKRVNESLSMAATSTSEPPPQCGQQYEYSFRFNAPSISCNDYYDPAPNPKLKFPDLFQAHSNVPSSLRNPSPQQELYLQLAWFDIQNEYDFLRAQEDRLEPINIRCNFMYSEYTANVSWNPLGRKFATQVMRLYYPLYNFYLPTLATLGTNKNYSITCVEENYSHCNFVGFVDAFTSLFPRNVSVWNNSDSFGALNSTFQINGSNSTITRFYLPFPDGYYGFEYSDTLQVALANALEAFLNVSRVYDLIPSQGASVYEHSSNYLWAFYGAALAAATLVSIAAIILAYRHGIPSAIGFSHFLIMTRNPALAHIAQNAPLGAYQLVDDVRRMNLRFGKLGVQHENSNEMVGFGIDDDEVVPLQKPVAKELW